MGTTLKAKPTKAPPVKYVNVAPPSSAELAAATKDVTLWVENNMRDWAIYSIKALQESPWPTPDEIPEWVGILAEGVEWAVVALAPEVAVVIEVGKTAIDVTGKAYTLAKAAGIAAPMERPDIRQIFSDGIDRYRGKVEGIIKSDFVPGWAKDVAYIRKGKPAPTDEQMKGFVWLNMFPDIDYDSDRYLGMKQAIVAAITAAIPVYKQQLEAWKSLPGECYAKRQLVTGGGMGFAFESVLNQSEVDACYAAIPDFRPNVNFKMPNNKAQAKALRDYVATVWRSMAVK